MAPPPPSSSNPPTSSIPSTTSAANTSSTANESYTAMSVGDVEAIGAHCQMPFCHVLDFLPFRCGSCRGTFCLDHRTETAHNCSNAGAWARARSGAFADGTSADRAASSSPKPTVLNHDSQCAEPSCKTLVNTSLTPGVHCATCRRDYCLKHRMKEDHDCDKLTPLGVGQQREAMNSALGKLRAWGAAKKAAAMGSSTGIGKTASTSTGAKTKETAATTSPTLQRIISPFTSRRSASSSASAQTLALNNLKRSAKGDAKIAPASRVYLHMEAVASSKEGSVNPKVPHAETFYSADWTVGRVLDAAAKTLGVTNVNNRGGGEEEKLRVFHVEGGKLLAFSEKLGAGVKSGDTLVLLRGVGDPDATA